MLKIGLFTFGGGYAMIHILENEFVSKKKWIEEEEFMDLVALAESTPGPIAINCSTYIGYKKEKILGAFWATLGCVFPHLPLSFAFRCFSINFCRSLGLHRRLREFRFALFFSFFRQA